MWGAGILSGRIGGCWMLRGMLADVWRIGKIWCVGWIGRRGKKASDAICGRRRRTGPEDGGRAICGKSGFRNWIRVVGIAASGTTPVRAGRDRFLRRKRGGIVTIGVAANRRSPLARAAKIAITPEVGA